MSADRPKPLAQGVDAELGALYDELRLVASAQMRRERPDHTLQPTALVHEAYLRLSQQKSLRWESREHLLNIAAAQIRRILVDHARARGREKRGGGRVRVTLTEGLVCEDRSFDLLELDQVLDRLDQSSQEDRRLVELKFFAGLTEAEIAATMGMSERTVRRRWLFVRAWLYAELSETE